MYNQKMYELGDKPSIIRELFEYGKAKKALIGEDSVFDFSIGNPSNPSPKVVNDTLINLLNSVDSVKLHGYTSAVGDYDVRWEIARYLNKTYGCKVSGDLIYLTVGAAAAITICLHALLNEGDEVIILAPFFPEYKVFVENALGVVRIVNCRCDNFEIDFDALTKAINAKTKAIIIDSPNNPTGVVYSKECISKLGMVLKDKEKVFNHPIYLLSDEPYRELIYDDMMYPFVTNYYDDSIVCYSFSKSLSLAGERIGYIVVGSNAFCHQNLYKAICGAGRALGYVCAPSLFQYMIPSCLGTFASIDVYKANRDLLYQGLQAIGYEIIYPKGAFYMFVKALEKDAIAFSNKAKQYELLLVPSDSFGYQGYVRISYCVSKDMIIRSMDAFKKLYDEYRGSNNE